LLAVIGEPGPLSDERLRELVETVLGDPGAGNAITLGISKAANSEKWIRMYARFNADGDHTEGQRRLAWFVSGRAAPPTASDRYEFMRIVYRLRAAWFSRRVSVVREVANHVAAPPNVADHVG
jgi:hypothetical protein